MPVPTASRNVFKPYIYTNASGLLVFKMFYKNTIIGSLKREDVTQKLLLKLQTLHSYASIQTRNDRQTMQI
jgi:hypothetical protein